MTRYHTDKNGNTPFTAEEEAEQDAIDVEIEASKPMNDWLSAMEATDKDIPRELEDLYDAMSPATQAKVAKKTRDKIIAKKELRGTKP